MENENNMTVNIHGGQVNMASGAAVINAIQNNGVSENELDIIIKGIKDNLSELKKDEADSIIDVVEMVKGELSTTTPKVSRLKNCLTFIGSMLTVANGIPVLVDNLQNLQEFILKCIK